MERRPRLTADQRREQLLEVAGERFATVGFHALSMEAIADAAGVSKPVLYQHFPSKRALYLALVEDAVGEMQQRVTQALEGTTDNGQRVQGAIRAFFDFVEDQRFRLLFLTSDAADPEIAALVDGARQGVAESVAKLIAADAGLSLASAELLATGIRGMAIEGAQWWVEQPDVAKEAAVELLARLLWRGLAGFERS
ncbi:MAG TPA: TetR/AcrR family transcriptional regulator [Euzebya sp.]|nr:TetR/AcrR family transcriptional regulator [Euzebya sp.]